MTAVPRETALPASGPADLCLPDGYVQRTINLTFDANRDDAYWTEWRLEASGRYQRHVYAWAARLIERAGLRSVLDVGCGVGTKLREVIAPVGVEITGLDQISAITKARELGCPGTLVPVDLESPSFEPRRAYDLILCADVLEHLIDPDPAMRLIRQCSHAGTLVILSTPDRRRRRGRDCMRSDKPEHVREWSRAEFRRFVHSRGFEVLCSRQTPQDDSPVRSHLRSELAWRLRLAKRSTLACHAVLCRAM